MFCENLDFKDQQRFYLKRVNKDPYRLLQNWQKHILEQKKVVNGKNLPYKVMTYDVMIYDIMTYDVDKSQMSKVKSRKVKVKSEKSKVIGQHVL